MKVCFLWALLCTLLNSFYVLFIGLLSPFFVSKVFQNALIARKPRYKATLQKKKKSFDFPGKSTRRALTRHLSRQTSWWYGVEVQGGQHSWRLFIVIFLRSEMFSNCCLTPAVFRGRLDQPTWKEKTTSNLLTLFPLQWGRKNVFSSS